MATILVVRQLLIAARLFTYIRLDNMKRGPFLLSGRSKLVSGPQWLKPTKRTFPRFQTYIYLCEKRCS